MNAYIGSGGRSWLKGAVSHHAENISDVVAEAVGLIVGVFLVVVHGEVTT